MLRRRAFPSPCTAFAAAAPGVARARPVAPAGAPLTVFATASLQVGLRALEIVHSTDAEAGRGVRVVGGFQAESRAPVTCAFAPTRRAAGDAQALPGLPTGPEAVEIRRRHGVTVQA
jgi:hypothetical protein